MALTANTPRANELGDINELPVKAAVRIFEGAAVGVQTADGLARPIATTDVFAGFAESESDNSLGAASAINVRVRNHGSCVLTVAGVVAASYNAKVYAVDDGTFTLTASTNVYIGRVKRVISAGVALVAFAGNASQVA